MATFQPSNPSPGTRTELPSLMDIDADSPLRARRTDLPGESSNGPRAFTAFTPVNAPLSAAGNQPMTSPTEVSPTGSSDRRTSVDSPEKQDKLEKKKYDPKDPDRPRRKKARRACFSCQRAHLTCGDERPCARCIKRGISATCQDGVRKKAKYLHDAPVDQLSSVLGTTYGAGSDAKATPKVPQAPSSHCTDGSNLAGSSGVPESTSMASSEIYAASGNASAFNGYPTSAQSLGPMSESLNAFGVHNSPAQPVFPPETTGATALGNVGTEGFNMEALFDPSNPALFSFELENLEHLNFGSQYGAMEFGILGHMSKTAGTGGQGMAGQNVSTPTTSAPLSGFNPFDNGDGSSQFPVFDGNMMSLDPNATFNQGTLQHGLPHAYAISAGSNSLASPSTENTASPQPNGLGNFESPGATPGASGSTRFPDGGPPARAAPQTAPTRPKPKLLKTTALLGKRRRDTTHIYESVQEPYSYINGFHKLITFLRSRFPPDKTLKIAKSLSSIRPSFLSCTTSLNRRDLIFMEQCLQRTLFEYEDFMTHTSAPTIVCRRTGEVAAVNKEFTALTGWTKDILLGKAPNENINTGSASRNGARAGSSSTGTTPVAGFVKPVEDGGKPQAVFIPELLDEESVVQFYEDYAHLAFGDSRGHVNRRCKLLKYRKADEGVSATAAATAALQGTGSSPAGKGKPGKSVLSNRVIKIDSEHGISKIEKDGKVECTYCWVIKRDVFDIPMLIVINFLPCYNRNQEPLPV